jgi:hypothetical protein|tara:strand:+ start:2694 stop:3539 length:846 start_codon:yes stop_codon:yes gene_type:complete
METIIGLGDAGCAVADCFKSYPQYEVYKINSEKKKEPNYLYITPQKSHEDYENKTRLRKAFFEKISGPILLILGGSGDISGASLRILEKLKNNPLYVLYIKPDDSLLSDIKQKQHKVVFNVLQQYARSALLEKMYIVENSKVEAALGELPVIGYHDKINQMVVSTMHMLNVCYNTDAVINTFSDPLDVCRISTFGITDPETGEDKLFYDLEYPREICLYYAINKEKLETDGSLLRKITTSVKEKNGEKTRTAFGIYPTEYERDYAYCVMHSSHIQEQKIDF